MRRSWFSLLTISTLAVLLAVLGLLQYRWLKQISESDSEKAHVRVQEQADRFAMDFNREIQNAYFNFQADPATWKAKDWNAFNERFDFWKERTAYPGLIENFYFFETNPDATPLVFDRAERSFVVTPLTPELAAIRARFADDRNFKPVDESSLLLVLPIHDVGHKLEQIVIGRQAPKNAEQMPMPRKYGFLVIKLNSKTLKDEILRDLVVKYYPDDEFRIQITDKEGNAIVRQPYGGDGDATAPLLDLSPENFIFYANKDLMRSVEGERRTVVLDSRIEGRTFNRIPGDAENRGTLKIEVKRDGAPRSSVFTSTTTTLGSSNGPWTLGVQHSSGSIDIYIANTLRRNLAIGFGILFLLAVAVASIVISAQRAKLLAQRQVDFVSSVSHEFRTPLAVIYSAGENLADGVAKEDAQVSRYGDLIKGEGKKLSSMVEQILNFAGANAGRRQYSFSPAEIEDVVEAAIIECLPLIEHEDVAVEKVVSKGLPKIGLDKNAMSQAVQNLIINAVKYCDGDKWLRVTAEDGDGRIRISVEDRGIGLSKTDLRRAFEPFYRSKQVVDAQIHGNGLGLSLVKQIAEAHGGRVFAASEIGKGSKFTIELPV